MRYEYFKIIDPAFVQPLLDGNLYMNSFRLMKTPKRFSSPAGSWLTSTTRTTPKKS